MSIVFPAGKNKVGWVSSPEEIEAKMQKLAAVAKGEVVAEDAGIEPDPQFDAIKGLPFIADEAEKLEGEIAGDVKSVAEEVKAVVEEAVEKATEAVKEVGEKVEQIVEKAEEKKEEKVSEEPKKEEKGEKEIEIVEEPKKDEKGEKKDDEVVVEIALEPEEEIPGGTVGPDGKESKEGCMAAAKTDVKVQAEAKPAVKAEAAPVSKVEAKTEAKPVAKTEVKVTAEDTSKFVKLSKLSPENKKELRDFWSTIFPAEYVNAMLKEY
jgi:hypothetical protein